MESWRFGALSSSAGLWFGGVYEPIMPMLRNRDNPGQLAFYLMADASRDIRARLWTIQAKSFLS